MNNDPNEQNVPQPTTPEPQPVEAPVEQSPELSAVETPPTITPTTPSTEPTEPVVAPIPEPPKKKTKKLLIIILTAVLVILLASGAAAYFLLLQKPAVTNDSSQASSTEAGAPVDTNKLTAKVLVEEAKAVVKGDAKETLLDTESKPYKIFSAPIFKPTGYDFWVSPSVDYGFGSYGTKDTISADLAAIEDKLTEKGLTGTVLDPGSDEGMYAAQYESDDIICQVTDQKPFQQLATSTDFSTFIGCADKSDYLANAAELKPYFVVYAAQSSFDTTKTAMSGLTITKSKTAGYSTAQVGIGGSEYGSVGGFAGLFYTTPDNKLNYFTGTQSLLLCSAFNTDDLKKAYLGETCYSDDDKESTVTL